MKVYLNDEKTHIDPRLQNDILWGLIALCVKVKLYKKIMQIPFWLGAWSMYISCIAYEFMCVIHGRRKVHKRMLVIWAAQPGPNGQLSCLHSFKVFWPIKSSYTSNEMTLYAAHFDVLKKYTIILKMCCSVNQIDDLQSSNKIPSSVVS